MRAPMRRILVIVSLLAATAIAGVVGYQLSQRPASRPEQPRVLFFGIDGGTWDVINPMIDAGELPNLAALRDRSLHGVLRSHRPAISPTAWTTIFTGKLAGVHGVDSWQHARSTNRKVKALWGITSEAGLVTHVFNVPSSWPAEDINGVMVSGFPISGSHVHGNTGLVVTRPDLYGEDLPKIYQDNVGLIAPLAEATAEGEWSPWIDVATGRRTGQMQLRGLPDHAWWLSPFYRTDDRLAYTTPPALRPQLATRLGQPYIPEGPGWDRYDEPQTPEYLFEHLLYVGAQQTEVAASRLADPWSLYLYVDTLVDRTSHPYWPYSDEDAYDRLPTPNQPRYASAVADAYKQVDTDLGRFLSAIDDDTYVVIGSDHGFQSNPDTARPIGVHHLNGIYLIAGPGVPAGEGPRQRIEDIGPTLLYLLGLPPADDMTGEAPKGLVDAMWPTLPAIPTYEGDAHLGTDLPVDQETWDQLRGLGYVDGENPNAEEGVGAAPAEPTPAAGAQP